MQYSRYLREKNGGQAAPLGKVSAPRQAARTLKTPHFLLHYTLFGVHKVRLFPGDSELAGLADSLYAASSRSRSVYDREKSVFNALDSKGAAHPKFVVRYSEYLEDAYDYFINTLKMKVPSFPYASPLFGAPAESNKCQIEFGHISDVDADYYGFATYALTYSPVQGGGIVFENDFIYTRADGVPDTISSSYEGIEPNMVLNYVKEWDKGIKVAVMHEFYHVIQFTYTPHPPYFHFWYEASAVGMEERLAPEVNDYLQYLPDLFSSHNNFRLDQLCDRCTKPYGNGIFHIFLTKLLGIDFDVGIWSDLGADRQIEEAFSQLFDGHLASMQDVYREYTQSLICSRNTDACPFEPFSPDADIWPEVRPVSLCLDAGSRRTITLPPLTYEVVRLESAAPSFRKKVYVSGGSGLSITSAYGNEIHEFPMEHDSDVYFISVPGSFDQPNLVLFSNGSWDASATIDITTFQEVFSSHISVFPNPVSLGGGLRDVSFTKTRNPASSTDVLIYTEEGRLVKKLAFRDDDADWSWNLRSESGERIERGVYYYKAGLQGLRPVLVF